MKINFIYDPIHEYQKMLFNMYKVSINWYQQKGYLASYYNEDESVTNTYGVLGEGFDYISYKEADIKLIIPNWDYVKSSAFWKKLSKLPRLYNKYFLTAGDKIPELYELCASDGPIDFSTYIKRWKEVESQFINYYNKYIDLQNKVKNVEIYLTRYGTSLVYNIGLDKDKSILRVYLRQDQDIDKIAKAIVSGYFTIALDPVENNPNTTYTWEEKNKIIDYHFINPPYKNLFPNYIFTVDILRVGEVKPKIIENSNKIYAEIGYPVNCELKIQNNQIKCGQIYIVSLTKSEKNVLIKMINKKGEMISYDQIAEVLWGQDYYNFFSIKAVNKIVERIKIKLKDQGVRKEIILNKRGLGYVYLG